MEKKVFVRIFTTKAGKKCTALVVPYGVDKEKLFFADHMTFMQLLDLKPTEYFDLANGEYAVK